MKNVKHLLALAGLTTALCLSTSQLNAQDRQGQGRGNFDPEEFRQRMEERLREDLEVKGDDEWKVIQPRLEAVQTAQRDLGGGRGFGAFGRGGGPGGPGGRGGDNEGPRGQGGRRGFGGGEPDADVQALRAAIESNASADEIKTKLAKVRESRKAKEAALEKARADLRQVLSVRQEAIAVMRGLLE